jgi:6-phosphogluconolactonase
MTSAVSRRRLIAMATGSALIGRRAPTFTNPIHPIPDPSGRFLIAANPGRQASLDVFARAPDGWAGPLIDRVVLTGTLGPHRVQQATARPGNVQFDPDGGFVIVPDLGRDRIESYRLSPAGTLTLAAAAIAREGAGPRDLRFHPALPFAYVVNALNATIAAYRFDPVSGALTPFQIVPSLPDHHVGRSSGGALIQSLDGLTLRAAHGGHVAIFAIAPATGRLTRKSSL